MNYNAYGSRPHESSKGHAVHYKGRGLAENRTSIASLEVHYDENYKCKQNLIETHT